VIADSAARLREAERAASLALDRGCVEDLGIIERFLSGPLRDAELEMRDEMMSLGDEHSLLSHSLAAQAINAVGERCWEKVFANVALRFRARFSMYADALVEAEARFFADAGLSKAALGRRKPRRVTVPRVIAPDAPALSIETGGRDSVVLGCVAQLERRLREAIAEEVEGARARLIRRGRLNLARTRIAFRLTGAALKGR